MLYLSITSKSNLIALLYHIIPEILVSVIPVQQECLYNH